MTPSHLERCAGSLVGLACGDAVGTTLEFRPRGSFTPLQDMVGGGPFGLSPGQWTDDTSMALCLAESLLTKNGFDATDQMGRYLNWYVLARGLDGATKHAMLDASTLHLSSPKVAALAAGSYLKKAESEVVGTGYAVASLEAALWCFKETDSFEAAVLRAANLGDDADTTAAIVGQVAGVHYGIQAIPDAWRVRLHMGAEIESIARQLGSARHGSD